MNPGERNGISTSMAGVPAERSFIRSQVEAVFRPAACFVLLVLVGLAFLQYGVWFEAEATESAVSRADRAAMVGLVLAVLSCVLMGQFLALVRIREWVLVVLCVIWYGIYGGGQIEAEGLRDRETVGTMLAIMLYLGPLFVLCGSWSLRTGRAIFAVWLPMSFAVGGAVLVAQASEKIPVWEAGQKWQIWEPLSVLGASLMVGLLFLYLSAGERQSLKMWRMGRTAHRPGPPMKYSAPPARLSILGWSWVVVLAFGISAAAATTAPFLWDLEASQDGYESQNLREGEPARRSDYRDVGDRGDLGVAAPTTPPPPPLVPPPFPDLPPWFLLNLLLACLVLAFMATYRPIRRLILVRHLRHPLWQEEPEQRVRNGWKLVEIAMNDAGFHVRRGEPASQFLKRVEPALQGLWTEGASLSGLREAAAIRDRVNFGWGIGPEDVERMENICRWTHAGIWERLGDGRKVRAMYRSLHDGAAGIGFAPDASANPGERRVRHPVLSGKGTKNLFWGMGFSILALVCYAVFRSPFLTILTAVPGVFLGLRGVQQIARSAPVPSGDSVDRRRS